MEAPSRPLVLISGVSEIASWSKVSLVSQLVIISDLFHISLQAAPLITAVTANAPWLTHLLAPWFSSWESAILMFTFPTHTQKNKTKLKTTVVELIVHDSTQCSSENAALFFWNCTEEFHKSSWNDPDCSFVYHFSLGYNSFSFLWSGLMIKIQSVTSWTVSPDWSEHGADLLYVLIQTCRFIKNTLYIYSTSETAFMSRLLQKCRTNNIV